MTHIDSIGCLNCVFKMIFMYVSHACNSVQIGLSLLLGFVRKSFQRGKCNSLSKENHRPCLCLGQLVPTEQESGSLSWRWPGHVGQGLSWPVLWGWVKSGSFWGVELEELWCGWERRTDRCHTGGAWGFPIDSSWVPGSDLGWRTSRWGWLLLPLWPLLLSPISKAKI